MQKRTPKDRYDRQQSLKKKLNDSGGRKNKADFSKIKSGSSTGPDERNLRLEAAKKRIKARELKEAKKNKKSPQSQKNLAMENARKDRKKAMKELMGG